MMGADPQQMEMALAFIEGGPKQKRELFVTITNKLLDKGRSLFEGKVFPEDGEDPTFQLMIVDLPGGNRLVSAVYMKDAEKT